MSSVGRLAAVHQIEALAERTRLGRTSWKDTEFYVVRLWQKPACSAVERHIREALSFSCSGKAWSYDKNAPETEAVNYKSETPFDNIESALEYVSHLLDATNEARTQIEREIVRAASPELARRKQALQLVSYKLDKLSSHIAASRHILNDLRTLRRLLLEERKTPS
jgi:hypothetical protein